MFRLQHLIRENTEDLARAITTEQGKTLADARGDVFRGLEVCLCRCCHELRVGLQLSVCFRWWSTRAALPASAWAKRLVPNALLV